MTKFVKNIVNFLINYTYTKKTHVIESNNQGFLDNREKILRIKLKSVQKCLCMNDKVYKDNHICI